MLKPSKLWLDQPVSRVGRKLKTLSVVTLSSMIMVALMLSGCSDSSSPEPEPEVALIVTTENLSGGDQSSWMIRAVASNGGGAAARYFPAQFSEINFTVFHESVGRVNVYDPSGPIARRPEDPLVLRPGASVESAVVLDGRYWDSRDVEHVMPPGVYRIEATFAYFFGPDETKSAIRQEIEIVWE